MRQIQIDFPVFMRCSNEMQPSLFIQ